MTKRVVITGLGVIAPNGIGKDEFWESIKIRLKKAVGFCWVKEGNYHGER